MVRQLRGNNINIGKACSIIGSFFGGAGNLPFTKRTLKNLCGRANDDVKKTVEVFAEIRAKDRESTYSVGRF